MRRILIVGNSGGGKSTLARRLGEKLALPVIHLDVLFWKPDWVEAQKDAFRADVRIALEAKAWVCDGNFAETLDIRLPRADTVVWIQQPPLLCLARAIWRVATYRGRHTRPDMAAGCDERFDPAFYRYIWDFDAKTAPRIEAALAKGAHNARVVRLRSNREIAAFLAACSELDSSTAVLQ
jgi:adenylate kinase family enzyme